MIRYRFHKMKGTDTTKCVTLNDDPKCKCTDDAKKSHLFASLRDSNKNFNFKDCHSFRTHKNIIIVMNFANGFFVLNGSLLLALREILHFGSLRILSADFVGILCAWHLRFSFDDFAILSLHRLNA